MTTLITRKEIKDALEYRLPSKQEQQALLDKIITHADEFRGTDLDSKKESSGKADSSRIRRVAVIFVAALGALLTASVTYAAFGGYIPVVTELVNPEAAAKHRQKNAAAEMNDNETLHVYASEELPPESDAAPASVHLDTDIPAESITWLKVSPYTITFQDADALAATLAAGEISVSDDPSDLHDLVFPTDSGWGAIDYSDESKGFQAGSFLEYHGYNTLQEDGFLIWDTAKEFPMTLSESEAEQTAREVLEALGLYDLTLHSLSKYSISANAGGEHRHLISDDSLPVYRYRLLFQRTYEGIPLLSLRGIQDLRKIPYGPQYNYEILAVEFTSDIITRIEWSSPLLQNECSTETADLLPFESLYSIFKKDLAAAGIRQGEARQNYQLLYFGWARVAEPNETEGFLMVPAVYFYGEVNYSYSDGEEYRGKGRAFIYNAVTGQRIDPELGIYME